MSREPKLEERILQILEENSGSFVSGSYLARTLGVTRVAVSKAVANLRKKGFLIESHSRLGYRLISLDSLADIGAFVRDLNTRLKFNVYYLHETSSTQDVAKGLAEHGAPEGTIVIAEKMTSGRGRLGRPWCAPPGGLWFTLVLRPKTEPSKIQLLSLMTGVAVAKAIKHICGISSFLKWPNDVRIQGKKVCGILVEGCIEADMVKYVLVGVGVNVNNEIPADLQDIAISIKDVLGRRCPRVPLLRSILISIDSLYTLFINGEYKKIIREWKQMAETLGKKVRVIFRDREVEGVAVDIKEDGSLIVRTPDGARIHVYSGDIIHLR